ncbi:MAG: glycoside hydrolase family 99-like domain-containing protein [Methylomicrobium sp.]|nr:glycoside hydrolase family 99-like domain-containing protein [Methylomicrobium sp.]
MTNPSADLNKRIRAIALYLPQFHPIPENDVWWGKGFTEWTNTAKAKPLFPRHYQPNVPGDLGFYDLRLPEARLAQAELAKEYGIEAFCYYHYWFAGKRILERPFNEVLESGEPDFPFCLCWANQTWSGIWHGAPNRTLIEQTYPGMGDHKRHFEYLLRSFQDHRYVKADGKPLFVIFQPRELPDSLRVTDYWRELALKNGLPGLYLVAQHDGSNIWEPKSAGFDAIYNVKLPPLKTEKVGWKKPLRKILNEYYKLLNYPSIYDYKKSLDEMPFYQVEGIDSLPCVIPNWDNTPRSGINGRVLFASTPELFKSHLRKALMRAKNLPDSRRFIFIKSWNEWAEGNYIEPDLRFGKKYLEVFQAELENFR